MLMYGCAATCSIGVLRHGQLKLKRRTDTDDFPEPRVPRGLQRIRSAFCPHIHLSVTIGTCDTVHSLQTRRSVATEHSVASPSPCRRIRSTSLTAPSLALQNPFGSAKPREAVIAQRTGKDEKEVLAEAAKEYQVKIRLTPEQFAEKKAKLTQIDELKAQLDGEPEDAEAIQVSMQHASGGSAQALNAT
jgi:hypothetical protein